MRAICAKTPLPRSPKRENGRGSMWSLARTMWSRDRKGAESSLGLATFLVFAALAHAQPSGCESAKCHVGIEPMHVSTAVKLTCKSCHGGDDATTDKLAAHVQP